MGLYDKIKILAEKQKLSIRRLEENLGYGNGTIRRWDKQTPGVDKIKEVADYFNVSVDYLLGRDINNQGDPTDLNDILDSVMSFDGEPMTENDREVIRAFLEGKFGK
ncbi:helix-turn-helix domain-containing protein [Vagococcus vulneris]|uniref:Transcriptional regulator n=1 Tax=Vagococcus vulneris TaxID=1977869 RepID=A0A429ZQP7_9ENTE|nr:helix-turn-helix transcriptional regulator [Vagococcus vulneris]RST96022.1 transcriptional regulator [Vagococcus vulneris]